MRRAFVLLILAAPCAASYAALGSTPSSLGATAAVVKVRSLAAVNAGAASASNGASATASSAAAGVKVSETTLDSGTVVREYASADGIVFALSWKGKTIPDLRTLLGSHFSALTNESAKKPRAGRAQLKVEGDDVVIVSGGHMRAYTGRAWIPSALPAGFTPATIDN